jgi:hypothetical protein
MSALYTIRLIEVLSGEARDYVLDMSGDEGESLEELEHGIVFNWSENNYSCDCNRRILWYRAKGEEPPEDVNDRARVCRGWRGYRVESIKSQDGRVIYAEE